MQSLNYCINEYKAQLTKGHIQKAYKGIMTFMSALSSYLKNNYTDYTVSGLYFGYMDMTYFAFTPPKLKNKKLKVAIVYLHEQGRFEIWLGGANRTIQAEYIKLLGQKDLGELKLSKAYPGVDSIIESILEQQPDFDCPNKLISQIESNTNKFINDVICILDK